MRDKYLTEAMGLKILQSFLVVVFGFGWYEVGVEMYKRPEEVWFIISLSPPLFLLVGYMVVAPTIFVFISSILALLNIKWKWSMWEMVKCP